MVNTKDGQEKARKTMLLRHGPDFYKRIGALGGKKSRGGGFASTKVGTDGLTGPERAKKVGTKGGKKSKRGRKE